MRHDPDSPGLPDPDEAAMLSLLDRREGLWTKLERLEMDRRFCEAVQRAYLEITPERRPRAA